MNFKDITPRFGAAYDLFGNGKTAIKANVGRYTTALGIGGGVLGEDAAPAVRLANTVTRSWNDRGGLGINGDYVPALRSDQPARQRRVRRHVERRFRQPDPQHDVSTRR